MTTRTIVGVFLLLRQAAIVAGQFDCDCRNGDVPIVEHFQIIQSPPDTCPQNCVWKVSANAGDQRVELVVQQVDAAITLTVLDGADEDSSPPISNCDTTIQESVCYSSGRYMIVKTDSKFGMIKNGNNVAVRMSSVAQIVNGGSGSHEDHDHTWLIVGLSVGLVLLLIIMIIISILVYTHIKKRQEGEYVTSTQANSDMIFVVPSTPTTIAPTAPHNSVVLTVNDPPKYEGTLQPSDPQPQEYFMRR